MKEIKVKFRNNLMHAIKYTNTRPKEPGYINEFLGLLHQYVQKLKQDNPGLTVEQLEKIFENDIYELSKAVYKGCISPAMYVEYATTLYLVKNPQKLNTLLEHIEKDGLTTDHDAFQEQGNFEENLLEYLLVMQNSFGEVLENYSADLISSELAQILNSPTLSAQEKNKKADAYVRYEILPAYHQKCFLAIRMHTVGLKAYLPEDLKAQEKDLRSTLVTYIADMTAQLKKLGLIEKYNRQHSSQMRRMGLDSLSYTEQDLELALNANYLTSLPIDDLLALGVFWLNRYTKELDTYTEAMFAINQFELLPQMLESSQIGSITVPEENLKEMLVKMHTLYYPCEQFFQEKQAEYDARSDEEETLSQEEEDGHFVLFSYDPLVARMQEDFGQEYETYFKYSLPNYQHDLEKDVRLYAKLQNPIYSAKTTKDDFITSLLISLDMNPNLINGGIILDDMDPANIASQRFVGIALDCNLTTPMRQHIRLDVLKEFLSSSYGHTKIQIYEGNSDFREWYGKTLTNSLCLPFSKKLEKSIKQALRNTDGLGEQAKKYLQHLEFLRDVKHIPEHLKTDGINKKGKKEKQFKKRYLDLSDGRIYHLEDGEYQLEEQPKGDNEYDER